MPASPRPRRPPDGPGALVEAAEAVAAVRINRRMEESWLRASAVVDHLRECLVAATAQAEEDVEKKSAKKHVHEDVRIFQ